MNDVVKSEAVTTEDAAWRLSRRSFLLASAAFFGTACGGGGASGSTGSAPADNLPPPAPAPTPVSMPINAGTPSFYVRSLSGGSALPFALGFAFAQGEIPAGSYAAGSGSGLAGLQVVPKNYWRDGSLKFALVAGRMDMAANVEGEVRLTATATAPSGAALTTNVLSSMATAIAVIGFGNYGSVTWSGTDWNTPFQTCASGPEMSSWVYRKPFSGDNHLVGWLEVRLFPGNLVEVVPWLENGYLRVAAPGQRSGTATFTLGATLRFSQTLTLLNHQRAVLVAGSAFSHWLGSDPQVVLRHDVAYLQSTRLTPAYRAVVGSSDAIWRRVATSYTPLGQGNFPTLMGNAGYDISIGPLPEWEVAYLAGGGDVRAWCAIQANGYAAGRYGYHFRDETTQRAPRMSQYPNLVMNNATSPNCAGFVSIGTSSTSPGTYTPAASGGVPPLLANSHMPAMAYMAYLVTGRWYFIDELQLLSSALQLKQSDTNRQGSKGLLLTEVGTNQTRGAAWSLRTLAHTAAMTPDADATMRAEYVGYVQSNIDWYYGQYVAKANNPLGLVQPYGDYTTGDGKYTAAWWMDDFFTYAMSLIKELQAHAQSFDARLDGVLAYKFKCVVGRLGPDQAGSYSYRRAAQYEGVFAPEENNPAPDFAGGTGPWYADWGAAYLAMNFSANGAGTNLLDAYADQEAFAISYWGDLQPAISYAVDNGAAGASDAYDRMVRAGNWAKNAAYFNLDPVWSVRPRSKTY
jgi:hypothetical protein